VIAMAYGCGLGRIAVPDDAPAGLVNGQPTSLDEAVDRATEILAAARAPLICGLTHLTCEAQRAAFALADRIGAAIDISGSPPAPLFPDLGTVTCTLGEVKNRADLIVFWGGRPDVSHPRLGRDFAVDPVGRFLPNGRRDRTLIVVGDRAVADAFAADVFLPATPAQDFAALWLLRALVQGKPVDPAIGPIAGIALTEWRGLAERLKRCKFGVLFLGPHNRRAAEAAHGLATDVNAFTRFYALSLQEPGNGVGAEQVFTWQTGYPAAVGLHGGYPRSFGNEFSAERLLPRRNGRGAPDWRWLR
jgi:formylmethanofuran dehydrogenase subunit B